MPPCPPSAVTGDRVYVVAGGWHTEIGIPMDELDEHLAFYRRIFPGARTIMFGYGKRQDRYSSIGPPCGGTTILAIEAATTRPRCWNCTLRAPAIQDS